MHRTLFFSVLLFFASCSHPEKQSVKEPDDLIPQEKMVSVLADVHLLEAVLGMRTPAPTQNLRMRLPQEFAHDSIAPIVSADGSQKGALPYYNIFKRYDITRKQFDASMEWYTANPDKLSELYDEVIIELTKRQTEDRTGKKEISSDSIKK